MIIIYLLVHLGAQFLQFFLFDPKMEKSNKQLNAVILAKKSSQIQSEQLVAKSREVKDTGKQSKAKGWGFSCTNISWLTFNSQILLAGY